MLVKKKAKPELVVRKNTTNTSSESNEKSATVTKNGTETGVKNNTSNSDKNSSSNIGGPPEEKVEMKSTATSSSVISKSTDRANTTQTSSVKPAAPSGLGLLGNYSDSDSDTSNSD